MNAAFWSQLTPGARRAMALAEEFARLRGEVERFPDPGLVLGMVSADHLLLGVSHPRVDADIWDRLGVDAGLIFQALERSLIVGTWPPAPEESPTADRIEPVDLQLDEGAQRALDYAAAEARRLRHPDIRPEHLLLGALRVGQATRRSPASVGCLVLAEFGVTLHAVFAAILAADAEAGLGRYAPRPTLSDF